jgi:hypothetical protein
MNENVVVTYLKVNTSITVAPSHKQNGNIEKNSRLNIP